MCGELCNKATCRFRKMKITEFSNHIIWSPKSKKAEEVWIKGKTMTSKTGRKVWLVLG